MASMEAPAMRWNSDRMRSARLRRMLYASHAYMRNCGRKNRQKRLVTVCNAVTSW